VSRHLWRSIAACLILSIVAAGCGNSGGDDTAATTTTAEGTPTTATGDRDTFVSISGVPGVTDDEIKFAAIGTKTNNPLGNCIFDCYVDGIKAYFAYRNAEGGIFGRDLVLSQELDDALGNNQAKSLEVASGSDAFGAFQATLLATGWGDLDAAGVPTYTWGIHATEAANRSHVFPSLPIRCGDCTGRAVPFAVREAGAKHVAALGYGDSENSKVCTRTIAASIELYSADIGGAEVAYVNEDLPFGGLAERIGPIVTAMKDAGVDFIATCIDSNGMKTLGDELARQGMDDVILSHPNSYDSAFLAEAGDLFEGDFVGVQYMPFEADTKGTAMADFIEWLGKQGREPNELSMAGWLNATLAFEGLLAAGPEFDRDKVTAATNAMTEFDAGGILQPVDWTAAHVPYTQATRDVDKSDECTVLVRIEGGKFVTVEPPATPWLCWPAGLEWSEPVPTSFG
jgi:hypothetical protein